MFEKALLTQGHTKTPAGVVLGMAGELAIVGVAILAPLIYTDRLPPLLWSTPLAVPTRAPEPPPPSPAVQIARERGATVVRVATSDTLMAPVRVPEKIAHLIEEPVHAGAGLYVPGAIPSSGAAVPGLAAVIGANPPPPPEHSTVEAPKAATERPVARIRVGGNVQSAKATNQVIPVYPALARQTRVQGVVSLVGVIGTDGRIRALRVVSGHPLLVRAALDAVRQWTYRPTLLNGEPVEVEAPIEVRFSLAQ